MFHIDQLYVNHDMIFGVWSLSDCSLLCCNQIWTINSIHKTAFRTVLFQQESDFQLKYRLSTKCIDRRSTSPVVVEYFGNLSTPTSSKVRHCSQPSAAIQLLIHPFIHNHVSQWRMLDLCRMWNRKHFSICFRLNFLKWPLKYLISSSIEVLSLDTDDQHWMWKRTWNRIACSRVARVNDVTRWLKRIDVIVMIHRLVIINITVVIIVGVNRVGVMERVWTLIIRWMKRVEILLGNWCLISRPLRQSWRKFTTV